MVYRIAEGGDKGRLTRDIVDILIDYDIHPRARIFVLCYLDDRKLFRHDVCGSFRLLSSPMKVLLRNECKYIYYR
jgi:hypothetical protein